MSSTELLARKVVALARPLCGMESTESRPGYTELEGVSTLVRGVPGELLERILSLLSSDVVSHEAKLVAAEYIRSTAIVPYLEMLDECDPDDPDTPDPMEPEEIAELSLLVNLAPLVGQLAPVPFNLSSAFRSINRCLGYAEAMTERREVATNHMWSQAEKTERAAIAALVHMFLLGHLLQSGPTQSDSEFLMGLKDHAEIIGKYADLIRERGHLDLEMLYALDASGGSYALSQGML